jgi:cytochrome c553
VPSERPFVLQGFQVKGWVRMEQPVARRAEDDQIRELGNHLTLWPTAKGRSAEPPV